MSQATLSWASRFHVPFEHGAWWSFFSTLAGGWGLSVAVGADRAAGLALAASLAAFFVAQDWAQAALGALLGRRSQALSPWQAWQGWGLAALALVSAGAVLALRPEQERRAWVLLLGALGAAAALGLLARVLQSGRGRKSLALTALLLAAPALPFGALSFGFTPKALAFCAWPLAYYPAATLAAQSYVRGFPEGARWAGPALVAGLGILAMTLGAWAAGGLLLAQGARLACSVRRRWRDRSVGLPEGRAIRRFGQEQAAFGVTLTLLWVWSFR